MADEKKGWGKTVLGWFVEVPDKPGAKPAAGAPKGDDAADDIIRRYSGDNGPGKADLPLRPPSLDQGPANSPSGEAPPDFGGGGVAAPSAKPGSTIDFDPVFKSAGVGDDERDKVKKALGLLDDLPAETPQNVKKQIVESSLKAFGVKIDAIIETAVAEIQALHSAIQSGAADTAKLIGEGQKRIASLEQQIAEVKKISADRQAEQANLEAQARGYGLRVQKILEFFGQEKVGEVVQQSDRLKDPTGAKPAAPKK